MSKPVDPLAYHLYLKMELHEKYINEWEKDLLSTLQNKDLFNAAKSDCINWIVLYEDTDEIAERERSIAAKENDTAYYREYEPRREPGGILASTFALTRQNNDSFEQFCCNLERFFVATKHERRFTIGASNIVSKGGLVCSAKGTNFSKMNRLRAALYKQPKGIPNTHELLKQARNNIEFSKVNKNNITETLNTLSDIVGPCFKESAWGQDTNGENEKIHSEIRDLMFECMNCKSDDLHEICFVPSQQCDILYIINKQKYDPATKSYSIYLRLSLPHIIFKDNSYILQESYVRLITKYCSLASGAKALAGMDAMTGNPVGSVDTNNYKRIYPPIENCDTGYDEISGIMWGMYLSNNIIDKIGGRDIIKGWNVFDVVVETGKTGIWCQITDNINIYPYEKCARIYDKLNDYTWHGSFRIGSFRIPSFRLPVKRDTIQFIGTSIIASI